LNLKLKVAAGTEFLVTQLFFDNQAYFEFVRKARENGISVPIVPGIMPVTNVSQLERFTSMCGASIPKKLMERLERVRNDENAVMAVGIEWALKQCRELLAGGAPGIHFYTLNRSLSTRIVFLGLQGFAFPGR
jgi:methylenetetrahydrofolate reductase (NADPH)